MEMLKFFIGNQAKTMVSMVDFRENADFTS